MLSEFRVIFYESILQSINQSIMETTMKRSNIVLASASAGTLCLLKFVYPFVQYMGSSNGIRAVCSSVASTVAENATIVRLHPFLPDDCSSFDAQTKIIGILNNRPRLTMLDISRHVLYDIYVSFGWILYKKFPRLQQLLMFDGRNAIITTSEITDFYCSFRPTPLLQKETVIEILLISLSHTDYITIQSFCSDPYIHVDLMNIARGSCSFICKYVEKEAQDKDTVEICIHVKNRLTTRKNFRVILIKESDMWMIHDVVNVSLSCNFCEKCKM